MSALAQGIWWGLIAAAIVGAVGALVAIWTATLAAAKTEEEEAEEAWAQIVMSSADGSQADALYDLADGESARCISTWRLGTATTESNGAPRSPIVLRMLE